ncbi:hypothetical protein [Salipiger abyssi]|uniref:Uncharacterized protein n=1 Tax=Salipiger abyssi TaxID=1250539 RepID=A0A1P8UYP2_9RHOB|nr:hypothetical protein [Salipiger abyssi]APZ54499.1 hypothetical protein Ga0080574_TMP4165 [Salipiger abyssi]
MTRQISATVTAFPVAAFPHPETPPETVPTPHARLFALLRQRETQRAAAGFVEERVVSPHFARAFQDQAAASFRHPPALSQD